MSRNNEQTFVDPDLTRHHVDFGGLAQSAHKSLEIIELWQKEKPLGHLQHIVDSIIKQGPPYYSAIQISVQNAHQGYIFADGAVDFFERLQGVTSDTGQLLEKGLQDLMDVAKAGQDSAARMNNIFKEIRTRLYAIAPDIRRMAHVEPPRHDGLPHPDLTSSLLIEVAADPDGQEKPAARGFIQLQRAANDLNALVDHVGAFVDWWGDMKAGLRNLKLRLPMVMSGGPDSLQAESVAERWKNIRTECYRYQQQISHVEDYYRNIAGTVTTTIGALPPAEESTPETSNDSEVQMNQSPAENATGAEPSQSSPSDGKRSYIEMMKAKVKSMTVKKPKAKSQPTSEKHGTRVGESQGGESGSKLTCTVQ